MGQRAAGSEFIWRSNVLRESIQNHFNEEASLGDFMHEEAVTSSFLEVDFGLLTTKLADEQLLNSIPTEDLNNEQAVFILANPETFRQEDNTMDETLDSARSFAFSL
eukprot:CAMPEP_0170555098 /NCGR_PEP_ID=MMETSP0211-20121228/12980_1 /TAXON_ID=311385 /ORGANISM="Pseudokeronopsis sp., Strain OXSARD2" /LENGTH=106 /DNA_ID=CAMNT_0010864673 /DNA_START=53 /DNA_END=369 /DNA_ORIENTATION=+